ncbi:DUF2254 family protein [Tateyamaria sp. ANG-S1]|uniref:DUF2254 family protein n=1 Tax=Tateyamaria sp. ANG-S1 TaxID=1577905 RepID=UPI00057EFB93|nr:DUF2254 family protein [Tateyamaria sp. ANG-S1]KIC48986.1 hypothetical protein RA29_15150 [Tateyamaria sp. ANG-S1]
MEFLKLLPMTILASVRKYTRKLWVRVTLMGLFAFVALGLSQLIEPMVPEDLATTLPGSAADRLLNVIANAMLAVTTFSLTVPALAHVRGRGMCRRTHGLCPRLTAGICSISTLTRCNRWRAITM